MDGTFGIKKNILVRSSTEVNGSYILARVKGLLKRGEICVNCATNNNNCVTFIGL